MVLLLLPVAVTPAVPPSTKRPWVLLLASVVRPASLYRLTVTLTLLPKLSTSPIVLPPKVTDASSSTA